jgi:ATP-dependent RNA helicase SUPV3L1/SUV3
MRRLAQKEELMSSVEEDGAIHVEGEYVGRIKGFNFIPDGTSESQEQRTLKAAAVHAVSAEIQARANAAATSADPDLKLTRDGNIIWNHEPIGFVEAGESLLKPVARVLASDLLYGQPREDVQARIQKFIDRHISTLLEPLLKLQENETLQGIARGIAFRIVETLGVLPREQVLEDVKSLSQEDRATLRAQGVRFGAFHIFTPLLLKPAATELRLLLWALQLKKAGTLELTALPMPPGQGLTSAVFDRSTPRGFYGVCGYRICGSRVVRIDMLERLADLVRERVFWRSRFPDEVRPSGSVEGGGFMIVADMMSLVGCSGEEFEGILRSLGFRMQKKKIRRPAAPAPIVETESPAAETETISAAVAEPEPEVAVPDPEPVVATATEAESVLAVEEPVSPPLEPTLEEIEIEVWWPRDTGPFRHRPEAKTQHRPQSKPKDQKERPPRPERKQQANERNERREEPKRRPEKPLDPNSPFAVLGALKAKMMGNKN